MYEIDNIKKLLLLLIDTEDIHHILTSSAYRLATMNLYYKDCIEFIDTLHVKQERCKLNNVSLNVYFKPMNGQLKVDVFLKRVYDYLCRDTPNKSHMEDIIEMIKVFVDILNSEVDDE